MCVTHCDGFGRKTGRLTLMDSVAYTKDLTIAGFLANWRSWVVRFNPHCVAYAILVTSLHPVGKWYSVGPNSERTSKARLQEAAVGNEREY